MAKIIALRVQDKYSWLIVGILEHCLILYTIKPVHPMAVGFRICNSISGSEVQNLKGLQVLYCQCSNLHHRVDELEKYDSLRLEQG